MSEKIELDLGDFWVLLSVVVFLFTCAASGCANYSAKSSILEQELQEEKDRNKELRDRHGY